MKPMGQPDGLCEEGAEGPYMNFMNFSFASSIT